MENIQLIKRPIESELEAFHNLFQSSLCHSHPLLNEVLSYIRQRNGKMMRPILVLLMAKLYGNVTERTLHAALALELLHTASLVHDDVVDESDERRGQSSVNAIYNNKVSVLVGDYMLATSLKHSALTKHLDIVEQIATLGQDLSEGEIIQLANVSNKDFSEDIYFDVIRKKTAALFRVCATVGVISAGGSSDEIEKAAMFGEMIGIAFQVKDDIFDYFESKEIGKPTGNDMAEGKLTLPALYVLNKLQDAKLSALALKIRSLEASPEEISHFIDIIKKEGGIAYAEQIMYQYRDKALSLLPDATDSSIRTALTAYIDYVIERTK